MNNATFEILGQLVAFEKADRRIAAPHLTAPLNGPVKVTVWATFQPPKSWPKKKTAANMNRPHIQHPNLDNLAEAIFNALNGLAYDDDNQVTAIEARKVWGPLERTVVTVEAITDETHPAIAPECPASGHMSAVQCRNALL